MVFNDPVMDDDEVSRAVTVRVCIGIIGDSMGCPAGMPDSNVTPELSGGTVIRWDPAFSFVNGNPVIHHRKSIGVIPPVLKFAKSFDDDRGSLPRTAVSDDATHLRPPSGRPLPPVSPQPCARREW